MPGTISKLQKELDELISEGTLLYFAMADELDKVSSEELERLTEGKKLPNFNLRYDAWYSVALRVLAQILPDRLDDFIAQYKNEKRKDISYLTYTISDYLLGLRSQRGARIVDPSAAFRKMERQLAIVSSAQEIFNSSLADISEVLQADLFDSELDAASELCKRGFVRGAGAVAGVVLEKHLAHVCETHELKTRKKNPTINDYNQMLKDNETIDVARWRSIQHLADLRNLCDHKKDREPTKDDAKELIEGVAKVIKIVH